jgi:hypothetical protein
LSVVHATARLALAGYALGLVLRCVDRPMSARVAWTAGFLLLCLHVAAAFHLVHGWSHADAYESTARRTADAVGWASGAGLYANYLFLLVWGADVAWWWLAPAGYRSRPAWAEGVIQGYLAFIAFNAAVIFAAGPARWVSLGVGVLIGVVWLRRRYNPLRAGDRLIP